MSVVSTNKYLKEYLRRRKEITPNEYLQLQKEVLCNPVAVYFEEYTAMELHKYFLDNGLFYPDAKIFQEIKGLEKKCVWEILECHYEKLQKDWNGEKAVIFIYPIERRNERIMKELKGKMGLSFHSVVVLFVTKEIPEKELKALLTHEYNHVCRLATINKDFDQLTLLDSMLVEGIAEVAVEELFGKEHLAPWVSLYSKKELLPHWSRVKRLLHLKGKEKHDPILYGTSLYNGFPKWFGYSIGYLIVSAYMKEHKEITMSELLKKDSFEILTNSGF
ncbi:DUF2268 domain-containing putative Zn-dependent protease [Bacillaceae bacterium IKA-2]|nr:DUF2268 domain-containing putative Zn-dependent protease [Bacillaceae bacterium IKA-2]